MIFKIYETAGTRQYTEGDIELLRELMRLNEEERAVLSLNDCEFHEDESDALMNEYISMGLELGVAEGRGLEMVYCLPSDLAEEAVEALLRSGCIAGASLIHLAPLRDLSGYPDTVLNSLRPLAVSLPGPLRLLEVATDKGLRRKLNFKGNPDKPEVARRIADRLRASGYHGYSYKDSLTVVLRGDIAHHITGRVLGPDATPTEGTQFGISEAAGV